MKRAFDHLVLAIDDLAIASDFYERIGFTLTPSAQHPFGTGNRLAQLQGCFLEILGITAPDDIPAAVPGVFSFGAFNRDYLARGQGLSMIVLQTRDAEADRQDFKKNNLTTYDLFDFSRIARQPDGRDVTVGFTLAFVSVPELPEAMAFTCEQWRPDLFWKSEYQIHANSAQRINEVFLVAEDPVPAETFIKGLSLDPIYGRVNVMSGIEFKRRFSGVSMPNGRFAGYQIGVDDIHKVRTCMEQNGVDYVDNSSGLWVTPDVGFGSVIEFKSVR